MHSNPFTREAERDGRAAYRPGRSAQAALIEALAAIAVVDGGPMPPRLRARYKVWFWWGWVSERRAQRAQGQRRAA